MSSVSYSVARRRGASTGSSTSINSTNSGGDDDSNGNGNWKGTRVTRNKNKNKNKNNRFVSERSTKSSKIFALIAFFLAMVTVAVFVFFVNNGTFLTVDSNEEAVATDIMTLSSSLFYFGIHNNSASPTTSTDSSKLYDGGNNNGIVYSSKQSTGSGSSSNIAKGNGDGDLMIIRRYDDAGPKGIKGTARSHALPNAVPITRQIPNSQAENKTYHLQQRRNTSKPLSQYTKPFKKKELNKPTSGKYNWNHDYSKDYRTLYLYNPSILPLHNTIGNGNDFHHDHDRDALSTEELMELTGGDDNVRYVVTYRAYLGSNCFGPDPEKREMMTAGEQLSYLAIALLDDNLDVIDNTDVLIDLNAGPSRGLYFRQFVEDCRIFCMKKSLFMLCNEELFMIQIKRQSSNSTNDNGNENDNENDNDPPPEGYGTRDDLKIPYIYPNVHGDGLQITLLAQNTKIGGGKNFNFFRIPSSKAMNSTMTAATTTAAAAADDDDSTHITQYDHFIQYLPIPHKHRRINLPDKQKPPARGSYHKDIRYEVFKEMGKENFLEESQPRPTFLTPDSQNNISICVDDGDDEKKNDNNKKECKNIVDRTFFEANDEFGDHGTACCVKVMLPVQRQEQQQQQQQEVMVGISHQKLSKRSNFWLSDIKNRYTHLGPDRFVSRFVAYETTFPFRIVAVSGWFCLGFAHNYERRRDDGDDNDNRDSTKSTLAGYNINMKTKLDLFNETYDCPVIHFASGFSEVVGNSSQAIIGYGINDCHPRMFKVDKQEIVQLLVRN